MVIATGMPMPTVMGMPVTMCTGTYTIGKHAGGGGVPIVFSRKDPMDEMKLTGLDFCDAKHIPLFCS